ncbi:hypothetical protein [Variovorax sp. RO1]|uniref:hypothetical protein n=1 Tax=Variovorax sp. RO1 TaxID=2066034 RepID=UPI00117D0A4B|nr:hypothetical protein [Variovorax sp. RO1]
MQFHSLTSARLASMLLLSLAMTACGGSGGGGNGGFLPIAPEPTTIAPIIPPDPAAPEVSCAA